MGALARLPAVAQRPAQVGIGRRARRHQQSLRVPGGFADDVDHAVHRVRAPERRARAADDFDAFDVLEHRLLLVPNPPENSGVYRLRPSRSTRSLLANTSPNPRVLIAQSLAPMPPTCIPGTR